MQSFKLFVQWAAPPVTQLVFKWMEQRFIMAIDSLVSFIIHNTSQINQTRYRKYYIILSKLQKYWDILRLSTECITIMVDFIS